MMLTLADDRQTIAVSRDGSPPARLLRIAVASAATTANAADGNDGRSRPRQPGRPRRYEQPPAGDAGPRRHADPVPFDEPSDVRPIWTDGWAHVQWKRPLATGNAEPSCACTRAPVQR